MWAKFKFLLLNIIPVVIGILNSVLGSNQWPADKNWIWLAVLILTAVLNAIGGTMQSIRIVKLIKLLHSKNINIKV
jgi:hypothetical protein